MVAWHARSLNWARTAVGAGVLAVLAACGGGGSGSSSSGGGAPTTVAVSGVASKGLMRNALVRAFAVGSSGQPGDTVLASTRTSLTDGTYELRGLPPGQVVMVQVTADADTQIDDEATGSVLTGSAVAGLTLRAATVTDSSGTTAVQVTPFSEMAVAIASSNSSGLTSSTVAAANAQVVLFLGGNDVLRERPEFDAETKAPKNAAAAALAAVSRLARDGGLGCGTAMAQPTQTTRRVVAADGPSPSEQADAVKCVVAQLSQRGTDDASVASSLEAQRSAVTSDPGYSGPAVPPVAVQARIEPGTVSTTVAGYIRDAKTLVSSLRATGAALGNKTEPTAITRRLQTVGDAFDAAVTPLDRSTWLQVVTTMAGSFILDSGPVLFSALTKDEQGRFDPFIELTDLDGVAGTEPVLCRFTDAEFSNVVQTSATRFLACRVTYAVRPATLPLPTGVSSSVTHVAFQHNLLLTLATTGDGVAVRSRLIRQFGTVPSGRFVASTASGDVRAVNGGVADFKDATATRTCVRTNDQVVSCSAFSVAGEIAAGLDTDGSAYSSRGTYQKVALNFLSSATGAGNTLTKLATTATFEVFDGATRVSSVVLKPGSEVIAKTRVAGDIAGVSSALADLAGASATFALDAVAPGGATLTGTLTASAFTADAVGRAVPTLASFTGVIKESSGTALFTGTLSATMPQYLQAEQGDDWAVTFAGTLVTSGTNTLGLNLTVTQTAHEVVDGKVARAFSLAGTYRENGADRVLLTGTVSEIDPSASSLTFSMPSGVGFTLADGVTSVVIAKGADRVGVYDVDKSLLVYADNSYERF